MRVIEGYRHIFFTCVPRPLPAVQAAVLEVLAGVSVLSFRENVRAMGLEDIYTDEPPAGARHPSSVMLFAPRTSPGCTVLFANAQDGWMTLTVSTSKKLAGPFYSLDLGSDRVEWPMYRLAVRENGEDIRCMHVMKDSDRWVFYQKGDPIPEEDVTMYQKRRVRDRMTREYLVGVAERLGFPVADDSFWRSDIEAVYFEEGLTKRPPPPKPGSRYRHGS